MSDFFVTSWTVASQAPLSVGFSWQEYRSGLPFPPSELTPNPEIEPMPSEAPALAGSFFTTEPPGQPATYMEGYSPRGRKELDTTERLTHGKVFIEYSVKTSPRRGLEGLMSLWISCQRCSEHPA